MKLLFLLALCMSFGLKVMAQCENCPYVELSYDDAGRRVLRQKITPAQIMQNPNHSSQNKDSIILGKGMDKSTKSIDVYSLSPINNMDNDTNPITNKLLTENKSFFNLAKLENTDIKVYPNPCFDQLNLVSKKTEFVGAQVTIFDELGHEVMKSIVNSEHAILTTNLKEANYFIEVKTVKNETYLFKILKLESE